MTHLVTRYSARPVWALFMLLNGFATIALLAAPAMVTGVSAARVGAAALSLASTAMMILLKAAHPPAGATTLIISLGIVTRPFHLLVIEIAVAILTLQEIAINRLAGIDYPLWALRDGAR
jgi:CBS-domain-containing membrane protein